MSGLFAPLLVFGEDWGVHPTSTQHLVRRLVADRTTLWVNSIGLRRPRLTARDLGRATSKVLSMIRGSRAPRPPIPDEPNLRVLNVHAVSWPGNPLARRLNRHLIPRSLAPAIRTFQDTAPILWASLPSAVDAIGYCGERAVVYYAGDDFESLVGVDHKPVRDMEREIAKRADLIIAASPTIAQKFDPAKTRLLPHGCDITLFSRPISPAPDLPTERPVAGFYGSLSGWLDIDLLCAVADLMPDWIFLFVGPILCDITRLQRRANVRILGPRPHAELPRYVQNWTVSLIPFKDTPQIRASNPLKLREYLAAGTPVVTTSFPALVPYREHVSIAHGPVAFASAIASAASEGPTQRHARHLSVSGESWESRSNQVDQWLRELH